MVENRQRENRAIDRRRRIEESRTDPSAVRGQSEPFAALVSVAVVCVAVSIYAGLVTETVPKIGNDRTVGEPAADSIWQEISEKSIYDQETAIPARLSDAALPQGYHSSISVSVVTEAGSLATVGSAQFDDTGEKSAAEPPQRGVERIERPVSVRLQSGEIRPGKFTVVVWE